MIFKTKKDGQKSRKICPHICPHVSIPV